jgi:hypothetical protein
MRQSNSGRTTGTGDANPDIEAIRSITGSYDELVRHDVDTDPAFREALRQEALACIREGDEETGRSILLRFFGTDDPATLPETEPAPNAGE